MGHSSVVGSRSGRLQDIQGWKQASCSQLIVKLVLLSQVDPTEDERSQGQSEHHDEDRGACVAFVLNLARSWGEGWPVGSISVISLAPLAMLLGTTLPGAKRATGAGGGSGLGSFYSRGRGCLCLQVERRKRGSQRHTSASEVASRMQTVNTGHKKIRRQVTGGYFHD